MKFTFDLPDGRTASVEAPEGTTQEQAWGHVQTKMGDQAPEAPASEGDMIGNIVQKVKGVLKPSEASMLERVLGGVSGLAVAGPVGAAVTAMHPREVGRAALSQAKATARGLPAAIGGAAGVVGGAMTGPLAPVAAPALGALGAGGAEYATQRLLGEEPSPGMTAVSAVMGAVPGLGPAARGVKALGKGVLRVMPGFSKAIRSTVSKKLQEAMVARFPDPGATRAAYDEFKAAHRNFNVPTDNLAKVLDSEISVIETAAGAVGVEKSKLIDKAFHSKLAELKGWAKSGSSKFNEFHAKMQVAGDLSASTDAQESRVGKLLYRTFQDEIDKAIARGTGPQDALGKLRTAQRTAKLGYARDEVVGAMDKSGFVNDAYGHFGGNLNTLAKALQTNKEITSRLAPAELKEIQELVTHYNKMNPGSGGQITFYVLGGSAGSAVGAMLGGPMGGMVGSAASIGAMGTMKVVEHHVAEALLSQPGRKVLRSLMTASPGQPIDYQVLLQGLGGASALTHREWAQEDEAKERDASTPEAAMRSDGAKRMGMKAARGDELAAVLRRNK